MAINLEDSFYIFDVGQGNCQLVIYGVQNLDGEKIKIGFLYDCGSMSTKEHEYVSLGDTVWQTTFQNDQSSIILQGKVKQPLSLKDILSGLKFCFVFLSHADQDHISLVNINNFPQKLHTVFFLGGDFLRKTSITVKTLFDFFIERTRNTEYLTWVEFPYYWSGDDNITYFKSFLLNSIKKHDQNFASFNVIKENNFFQGSFLELIKKLELINEGSPTFQKVIKTLDLKNNTNLINIFEEHVFIFAMNQKLDNVNAQSTVMSFILSNNKIQLICTGDAHKETFELIKNEKTKDIISKCVNMEKILIIPHHGSFNNRSDTMIEFFKPTIYIISAASGTYQCHPQKETYDYLNNNKKTEDNTGNITFYHDQAFVDKKEKDFQIKVYSMVNQTKTKYYGYFIKGKIPVLGTNAMGTIYLHSTIENLNINKSEPLQEIQEKIENLSFNDHKEDILEPKSSNVSNKEKSNGVNDEEKSDDKDDEE
jgi:hypothetical protein